MINRSDERKQVASAHHAEHDEKGYGEHGYDEEVKADEHGGKNADRAGNRAHVEKGEHVSHERDHRMSHSDQGDMGSAMGRSPSAARHDQARKQKADKDEQLGEHHHVSGGRGIMHESVDADHVIGDGGSIGVKSAEGVSDMASSKANRKEAGEPEREENEKAAMGRERTTPTKHTMGHGERETVAKHTI